MPYRHIPLFPPGCDPHGPIRMPVFDHFDCCKPREECQRVQIRNPACPDEYADVELCVDCDGNLSICVKRPNRVYPPMNCGHRPGCGCSNRCR